MDGWNSPFIVTLFLLYALLEAWLGKTKMTEIGSVLEGIYKVVIACKDALKPKPKVDPK